MLRAQEIWNTYRGELLPLIERQGYARQFDDLDPIYSYSEMQNMDATSTTVKLYEYWKHHYFDNAHGREIVEIRCGDICVERLSP